MVQEVTNADLLRSKRPHFGRKQVRSLRGIKVGGIYQDMCGYLPPGIRFKIVAKPYYDGPLLYVRAITPSGTRVKVNLSNCGVVPYPNGKWDPIRWLKRIKQPKKLGG